MEKLDSAQARFYGGGGANRALAPKSAISPKDLRGFRRAKLQKIKP